MIPNDPKVRPVPHTILEVMISAIFVSFILYQPVLFKVRIFMFYVILIVIIPFLINMGECISID